MTEHFAILASLGVATLLMAWLPSISKKINISYPIFLILIGMGLYHLKIPFLWPDPYWPDYWVMCISEIIVIISLMGAGLAIGKTFDRKSWIMPLRLILITMPLCMIAIFLLGQYWLALSFPASLLLAAVLVPTDPVLASEVQLDEPSTENQADKELQFTLTGEAGLNDGFAYPFTFLAILVAQAGSWAAFDLTHWFWDKLVLKIVLGIVIGLVLGKAVGMLLDQLPKKAGLKTWDGFLALSTTFMVYGITELLHGYGFLAVFAAGLAIRYTEKVEGDYKKKMHDFINEIERLLLVVWLMLFGGSLMNGILEIADWRTVVFGLVLIFIIRPFAGMVALIGQKQSWEEKLGISFLGIRGIGSIFYLAFAFVQVSDFPNKDLLYSICSWVILLSVIIHGLTVPWIMKRLG